eukprot:6476524-Amphidinium_carterae.1
MAKHRFSVMKFPHGGYSTCWACRLTDHPSPGSTWSVSLTERSFAAMITSGCCLRVAIRRSKLTKPRPPAEARGAPSGTPMRLPLPASNSARVDAPELPRPNNSGGGGVFFRPSRELTSLFNNSSLSFVATTRDAFGGGGARGACGMTSGKPPPSPMPSKRRASCTAASPDTELAGTPSKPRPKPGGDWSLAFPSS